MQNLVSILTKFSDYQMFFVVVSFAIFVVVAILTAVIDEEYQFIFTAFTIITAIVPIVVFIFFMGEQANAVKNHEYTATRDQMTLEIESKSDMIKSHKFKIDSEDDTHIYIKTSSLFGTNTYVIEKSELDSVDGN